MVRITLSGIDEKTNLFSLFPFNQLQYGVEYAILLSANPEGRNRYPSVEWIRKAIEHNLNFAVHICGSKARENALAGEYDDILSHEHVERVQVNGKVSVEELRTFCKLVPCFTRVITQDCPANRDLAKIPYEPRLSRLHQILIDGSGGRGIVRENWELPEHLKSFRGTIGFAGGLGPDNLAAAMPKIKNNELWQEPWVDMETKLRDENDWFSSDKAYECTRIVINREYHE